MEKREAVKRQYATADKLNVRIDFQQRFSQNKQGFAPWLMEQYVFSANARVLELGCGTGGMWQGRQELIDRFDELMLTDFSEGMLQDAQNNLKDMRGIRFQLADIQNLPFADDSYDFVIANMMLYHVPDRPKAIAEVRRVLKPDGIFVCATYGEDGIAPYLKRMMDGIVAMKDPNTNFTLQNGGELLRAQFDQVERRDYPDYFLVDDADAVVRYLMSMTEMLLVHGDGFSYGLLKTIVQSCMDAEGGTLRIPKEYGTFICR